MSDLPTYKLKRIFDAPRELVWRTWTDPELLNQWYGPGADTIIHEFDLSPEGQWLNEMKYGENSFFQKVIFKEVNEPEKIIWHHHSSTDENWNDIPSPMMPNWPALLLTTVTFIDQGDQTNVILTQTPMNASNDEIAGFSAMMSKMDGGWGSGYKIIDEILKNIA
ncbi:SRPBCC family protein [Pseudemcibacter aquimaris]|uniref:SRPBCC family protein n=1 Tax=Pseudemcibacter aquimaris TaxID=2857064 RepID=UPI002010C995|nr:SRPBCC domain-containing protein [Pseudemcibacter aquimaris]MCC3859598.1 SRPBCC domain-containing protein [Pseudemcibacter aquimaris]WDU59994.1 SRPBCC domain-containing protein [Pseudemcibacter aquimaris]